MTSGRCSSLDLQFCHQVVVALGVLALEVLHEAAAFADFLDQTAAGREVLFVRAEVIGELLNLFGEKSDLDLGGASVRSVRLELFNDALLAVRIQHGCIGLSRSRTICVDVFLSG